MLGLTLRKIAHVTHLRRISVYPFEHFEQLSRYDPFQPATIPSPRLTWQASDTMRLRWYMPEPGRGSGGHRTLFRLIALLAARGHRSHVAIMEGARVSRTRSEMCRFIAENFGVQVPVVWDTDELPDVDVVLATSWQSAYAAVGDTRCALQAYVVQDWEPEFHPRGGEYILAENSYQLGLLHITGGPWLAQRLRALGLPAEHFYLGADQQEYYPCGGERLPGSHVVFYARNFTPRRCFDLGCEALRLLDEQLPEGTLTVSMVGAKIEPFPARYRVRWLGIRWPGELRQLYSSSDAVLAMSATSPSLVLLEAALCEAPVVELDLPNTEGTFIDGVTGRLAPPSPGGLARTLGEVLADRGAARAMGRRARQYALGFTWGAAAETVERHLLDGLRSGPRPRSAAATWRQRSGPIPHGATSTLSGSA